MIPTLLDVLCHRAPYFNKKNYLDKVPAETIGNFNTATQKIHETMRPKLADMWKEWAAKNSDSLKLMVSIRRCRRRRRRRRARWHFEKQVREPIEPALAELDGARS